MQVRFSPRESVPIPTRRRDVGGSCSMIGGRLNRSIGAYRFADIILAMLSGTSSRSG